MNWDDLAPHERDALVGKNVFDYDGVMPAYSTDATAADAIEDELARQGIEDVYLFALQRVTGASRIYALYIATPDERCLAALRAKGVAI